MYIHVSFNIKPLKSEINYDSRQMRFLFAQHSFSPSLAEDIRVRGNLQRQCRTRECVETSFKVSPVFLTRNVHTYTAKKISSTRELVTTYDAYYFNFQLSMRNSFSLHKARHLKQSKLNERHTHTRYVERIR